MASRTAWVAGNGVGFTWTTAINSADLVSMPNGSSVLSSVTGIANQTNLDMFMDVSVRCAIASSTIAAGANLAVWLYALLDDGSTYGDGQFTAGTQAAKTPTFAPCGMVSLVAAASQTTLTGFIQQVIIPPGTFKLALQNNSGFTFTAGTQTVMYRTYNLNLNS
jgi:hypothetical protein